MVETKVNFKEKARDSIIRAAEILADQADNIVNDVVVSNVSEIYVTIRITGDMNPSMDVTKTYGCL